MLLFLALFEFALFFLLLLLLFLLNFLSCRRGIVLLLVGRVQTKALVDQLFLDGLSEVSLDHLMKLRLKIMLPDVVPVVYFLKRNLRQVLDDFHGVGHPVDHVEHVF